MNKLLLCIFLIVILISSAALAAPIYFNDRDAFDAATGGGLNFESFENDFTGGGTIGFGGFAVSETGTTPALVQVRGSDHLSAAITDGTGAIAYADNGDSIGTFFSFNSAINAFGLDIAIMLNGGPGSTITIGGSVSDSIFLADNTASFWGVIDYAGVSSISFDATRWPHVGFDAVSYGMAPVPEPATMLLLATGLVGLAGFGRKRFFKR